MSLVFKPAELPQDAVELGRIADAWGVKGWMKIHAHNSTDPTALSAAPQWYLQTPTPPFDLAFKAFQGTVCVTVTAVKPHADTLVAACAEVCDRTTAERLKGARIFVSRQHFPANNDPDEFYWVDLIGKRVVNREGVELGCVRDLLNTGPHAVLCIAYTHNDGQPGERLMPFVSVFVDEVNLRTGVITVDWQADY